MAIPIVDCNRDKYLMKGLAMKQTGEIIRIQDVSEPACFWESCIYRTQWRLSAVVKNECSRQAGLAVTQAQVGLAVHGQGTW